MISYPRLSRSVALIEADRIRTAMHGGGLSAVADLVGVHHSRQQPVSTGRIATPDEIGAVRSQVVQALEPWFAAGRVADKALFDRELGSALHASLAIVPSDAAHEETWNFLSTIVLPDVVAIRFPSIPDPRILGGHRNVLRKVWMRQEVLGDDLSTLGLMEDELVGLFERTALVRNRRLARMAAETVAAHKGPERDKWARKFYKMITFQTGVRLLDSLDDESLRDVLNACAYGADELSLLPSEQGETED